MLPYKSHEKYLLAFRSWKEFHFKNIVSGWALYLSAFKNLWQLCIPYVVEIWNKKRVWRSFTEGSELYAQLYMTNVVLCEALGDTVQEGVWKDVFLTRICSVIFTLSYISDLSGKFIFSFTHSYSLIRHWLDTYYMPGHHHAGTGLEVKCIITTLRTIHGLKWERELF